MAITKNLIHFNEKTKFEEKLANNEILDTSIVFIKDTQEIYTHGQLYKCADPDLSIYLTTTNAGNTYATITTANGLQENIDDVITDLQDYKTTVASTYITPNEVDTKIAALVDSAPTTLNTLNELAAALGDDPNFATTVATNIGKKADQSALDNTNAKFNNYLPLTGGRLKGELKINTEAENDNQKFGFFKTDNSNQNNYGCLQIGTNVGAEKPIGITLSGCDPTLTPNGTDKYGLCVVGLGRGYTTQELKDLTRNSDKTENCRVVVNGNLLMENGKIIGTANAADSVPWTGVTGRPTSLPASDVYAWAKKSSLALEDVPDLSSKYLSLSGGTLTGNGAGILTVNRQDGNPVIEFRYNGSLKGRYGFATDGTPIGVVAGSQVTLLHSGNVGDYALKKVANVTSLNTNAGEFFYSGFRPAHIPYGNYVGGITLQTFLDAENDYRTQLAFSTDAKGFVRSYTNESWSDWKTIAFTDSNVASATKLETARTIWGQSFDGTADISGNLTIGKQSKDYTTQNYLYLWKGDGTYRHRGMLYVNENGASYDYYNPDAGIYRQLLLSPNGLVYNYTDGKPSFFINSSGNVTIGGSDLASTTTKLYVDGGIRFAPRTIWGQSFDGTADVAAQITFNANNAALAAWKKDGSNTSIFLQVNPDRHLLIGQGTARENGGLYLYGNDIRMCYGNAGSSSNTAMLINSSGNVTIGSSDTAGTSYKLRVDGISRFTDRVSVTSLRIVPVNGSYAADFAIDGSSLTLNRELKFTNVTASDICSGIAAAFKTSLAQAENLIARNIILGASSGSASNLALNFQKYSSVSNTAPNGLTTLMTLTTDGNLGIGTASPEYKLDVVGKARISDELIVTYPTGFRWAYGNYGTLFRNDGQNFYILLTDSGGALTGSWNSLRPFRISLTTGDVTMEHNLDVKGTIKSSSVICGTTRLRVNSPTNGGVFGFMDAQLFQDTNNVSSVHIGSCFGGNSTIDDTTEHPSGVNMTAISIYRGRVGIGKRWSDTELRALHDANCSLGVWNNAHIMGNLAVSSIYSDNGQSGAAGVVLRNEGGIEITHASTPYIDFHNEAGTTDFGHRLVARTSTVFAYSGNYFCPYGSESLGASSYRWKSVYAKAGNFSDDMEINGALTVGAGAAITGAVTIDGETAATQTWVTSQGYITGITAGTGLTGGGTSGTVTLGLTSTYQTYISNGNTAYGWGNHSGKYLPIGGGTCTGAITATAFYQSSDETLKVFGDDISIDFNALKRIPKKYFNWKDGDGTIEIGTGAQSLQKVYPELVTESNGHLVVAYDKLSIIALKAIDILHAENQELKNRLTKLEEMVYGNRN